MRLPQQRGLGKSFWLESFGGDFGNMNTFAKVFTGLALVAGLSVVASAATINGSDSLTANSVACNTGSLATCVTFTSSSDQTSATGVGDYNPAVPLGTTFTDNG